MSLEVLELLKGEMRGGSVELCGSRVTCDPIPAGADYDYLVFCPTDDDVRHMVNYLGAENYKWESSEHYQQVAQTGFMSWRRGDCNVLLTSNHVWLERHHVATEKCKQQNILDKEERIKIFQQILYHSSDTEIAEILRQRRERLASAK